MAEVQQFIVKGFNNLKIYCKITAMPIYGKSTPNYTISFGGKHTFCFTAAIHANTPNTCYIDRVQYNSACVVDGSLKERGNTTQLVRLALWTIVTKFPAVEQFTLMDDSYIYCNGEGTGVRISLSHDSLLKYNQTWYQRNFNAELPNLYAKQLDDSLAILDMPLDSFEFMSARLPDLEPYSNFYTGTPRNFIQNLRKEYGAMYCYKVGPWLEKYTGLLNISIYKEHWFIRKESVQFPPNYNIQQSGGGIHSYTRRHRYKQKNFSIVSHNSYGGWNN